MGIPLNYEPPISFLTKNFEPFATQILQMHLRMKTAGLSDYIVIARIMKSDVLYSYKTVQLTLYSISSSIMRGAAEVEFVGAIVSNCVEMRFPAYRLA